MNLRRPDLTSALLQTVLQLDFPATADGWQGGQPVVLMPSIDLAVVQFAAGRAPRWANVLFSREHSLGVVAETGPQAAACAMCTSMPICATRRVTPSPGGPAAAGRNCRGRDCPATARIALLRLIPPHCSS